MPKPLQAIGIHTFSHDSWWYFLFSVLKPHETFFIVFSNPPAIEGGMANNDNMKTGKDASVNLIRISLPAFARYYFSIVLVSIKFFQ